MNINPKEIILGILASGGGIVSLMLWHDSMPEILLGVSAYGKLGAAIGFLAIGAVFFACTALFARNQWVVYGGAALFGIAPIYFMAPEGNAIFLILLPLFFSIFAAYRIQNEMRYSCGFNAFGHMRAGLPYYFTAAACAISIFYFSNLKNDEAASALLPRPAFDFTMRTLREPLQSFIGIPSFDPDETVDELLVSLLKSELDRKNISFQQVPKQEIIKLIAAQRTEISRRYGLKIQGNEKITDIFYKTATTRIEDFAGPYKKYLPYISALAVFFAFKAFTLPLYLVSVLITAGLIRLLLKSNILRKATEDIKVERVVLA